MLKNIATTRCECTTKNTKTRRATTQTTSFLIWLTFLAMTEKRSQDRLKKEIFIFAKNLVPTKNWFAVSNFYELPEHHMEKQCSGHFYFLLKTKVKLTTFSYKILKDSLIKQVFPYRSYFSIFVLGWDVSKLIKNSFVKIKKQLILTNFNIAM